MFKTELNSNTYLYEEGKYIDDGHGDEAEAIALKNLKDKTLLELITILDDPNDPIDRDIAKILILRKLKLVDLDRFQYALDEIISEIDTNKKEMKELEKNFKAHRHNMDKSYSEKPA